VAGSKKKTHTIPYEQLLGYWEHPRTHGRGKKGKTFTSSSPASSSSSSSSLRSSQIIRSLLAESTNSGIEGVSDPVAGVDVPLTAAAGLSACCLSILSRMRLPLVRLGARGKYVSDEERMRIWLREERGLLVT
jgi:hypothetical protein